MNDFLSLKTDVLKKQNEKDNLETEITVKRKTAQTVYESESALMQEKLDRKAENLESEYKEIVKEANQQYLQVLEDLSTRAQENVESISLLELKLKELKAKHDAAVEEYKRAQEMETQAEFYKLQLSERDLEEIKKLREVEPYLRDPRPLNKVI